MAYNTDGNILKPIIIRGARLSETTLNKYGHKYIFQTVEGTKMNETCLFTMKDQIERSVKYVITVKYLCFHIYQHLYKHPLTFHVANL